MTMASGKHITHVKKPPDTDSNALIVMSTIPVPSMLENTLPIWRTIELIASRSKNPPPWKPVPPPIGGNPIMNTARTARGRTRLSVVCAAMKSRDDPDVYTSMFWNAMTISDTSTNTSATLCRKR